MTAFNREKFISASIESVLASTFEDFELIIVDDCSTDNTWELAKEYALSDPRVRVFRNEHNLGDYPNRNKAASLARGSYLKYLDSDDLIYSHGLGTMVAAMEQFPEATFGVNFPDPNLPVPYPLVVSSRQVFLQQFAGDGFFFTGPSGAIIRRDVFLKAGCFEETRFVGDLHCWLHMSMFSPVVIFQPGLIWWRTHPNQEYSLGQRPERYLKLTLDLYRKFLEHPQSPLPEEEKRLTKRMFISRQARKVLHYLLLLRPAYAMKVFSASGLNCFHLPRGLRKTPITFDFRKEV